MLPPLPPLPRPPPPPPLPPHVGVGAHALAEDERLRVLRFAATFLWADLELDLAEHAFFVDLASELGVPDCALDSVVELLTSPPEPEDIDPTLVSPALAATVRNVALRAIASDGRVLPREMELFELLDELLPQGAS
jgi:hypothetical protein